MATSYSFGRRYAPPIVTYRVAPKRVSEAGKGSDSSRYLAWNIAGVVTPVAAITLGAMAFATTSDIPVVPSHRSDPAIGGIAHPQSKQALVDDAAAGFTFSAPSIPTIRTADEPARLAEAIAAPTAREPVRQSRKAAAPNHFRVAIVVHPEAAKPVGMSQAIAEAVTRPVEVDPLSPPKLTNLAAKKVRNGGMGDTPANISVPAEPAQSQRVELMLAAVPEPGTPATTGIIRRDYSRTLAIGETSRDVALSDAVVRQPQLAARPAPPETPAIGTIRDKMAVVKKASVTKTALRDEDRAKQSTLANEGASVASGKVADADMAFVDGELSAVRIGALLDIVKSDLGPDAYAAFSNSRHADSFVSTQMLRDAGIDASGDPATGKINLSSRN